LHGTAAGTQIHHMVTHCVKSSMKNKDPELHVFNLIDVKDALGISGVEYAQRMFDFYASFGQPTRVDTMGSGKFEKLCRDIRLYKILEDNTGREVNESEIPGEVNPIDVDLCFKRHMLSSNSSSKKQAKLKTPAAGAFNGQVDFSGFLMLISDLAALKFPKTKTESKALSLLWEAHIKPYAKVAAAAGEKEEDSLTSAHVTKLFQQVQKQLTAFFKLYGLPGQGLDGIEYFMTRDSLMKMARDFEILPRLISQREVAQVIQAAGIRSSGGRSKPKVSFSQYIDVLGRIALTAFGKYPHCNKHRTALQRVEALIIYLDMSDGRQKTGLKSDPWVTQQLEKNKRR